VNSDTAHFGRGDSRLRWEDNIKMDTKKLGRQDSSDDLVLRKDSGHGVSYDCELRFDETSTARFIKPSAHH
jgi:hypothetical protein